ncbi:MAG: cytochrome b/b6 domain-containing protein [Epsilonproteobacteria bacterium]|nr:cytochrome b/b6 domain-containing protein [Campylobacterota bacterium]
MRQLLFSYTTRVLHFFFATFVLASYLLSDTPSLIWLHSTLGIGVLLVVFLRIIWFFIGENVVRFSSFDLSVTSLKNYMVNYFSFKNIKLRNPATSYGAILMWISALLVGVSGLLFIGAKYGSGIFGGLYFLEIDKHLVKEAHELFGNILIVIAIIHILGVVGEQILKKSGIIKTMFDGKIEGEDINFILFQNSKITAILVGGLIVSFVAYLGIIKSNPFFNSEIAHTEYKTVAPVMSSECKECHLFYPPNVTSLESQLNILEGLSNHFGTDASLDDETLALITAETKKLAPLESHFMFEDLKNNESLTKTSQWKKEHKEYNDKWFLEHKIKKTDCKSCHINFEKGSINPFELRDKI